MAHKINIKNKQASLFLVKEKAWHGLGKVLDNPPTVEEGIIYAGLDYKVNKGQTYVHTGGNDVKKVEGKYMTYREDTGQIFGDVKSNYTIVQNVDAFKFFDPLIKEFDLTLETAGALGNGEEVFITAKTSSPLKIKGVDIVDNYLLLTNRHDGRGSIQIMFTPVRVVCNNTLCTALRDNVNKVSFKHTKSIHDNLRTAQAGLQEIFTDSISLEAYYTMLAQSEVSDVKVRNYIIDSLDLIVSEESLNVSAQTDLDKLVNPKQLERRLKSDIQTLNEILNYYQIGPGQASIVGTAYGAYNAVSGYYSNVKTYSSAEIKINSLVRNGEDYKVNKRAFELASTLAF